MLDAASTLVWDASRARFHQASQVDVFYVFAKV